MPVLFGTSHFLLYLLQRRHDLATDSDDEISGAQSLCRSGTILWNLGDNDALRRLR